MARAQALRCSTRQAVGRRRSGSRFCSMSDRSPQKDGNMKADRLANDEATGKVCVRELAASSYEPRGSADWKDTLLSAESLVRRTQVNNRDS